MPSVSSNAAIGRGGNEPTKGTARFAMDRLRPNTIWADGPHRHNWTDTGHHCLLQLSQVLCCSQMCYRQQQYDDDEQVQLLFSLSLSLKASVVRGFLHIKDDIRELEGRARRVVVEMGPRTRNHGPTGYQVMHA